MAGAGASGRIAIASVCGALGIAGVLGEHRGCGGLHDRATQATREADPRADDVGPRVAEPRQRVRVVVDLDPDLLDRILAEAFGLLERPGVRVQGESAARLLSEAIRAHSVTLSAVQAGVKEVREAVAEAVLWLIDARMVTGQMIAVDGGQHIGWKTPDIVE